jgi:hypothetical protein
MKKVLLSIICFFVYIFSIRSQTLYGTTFNGGNDGGGIISEFNPAIKNLSVSKSFETYAANPFFTNFIQASDGKLYGMAGGGINSGGVIFSYDPIFSTYKKLMNFDGTNGSGPLGSLIQASDGKLYGMTSGGEAATMVLFFPMILLLPLIQS